MPKDRMSQLEVFIPILFKLADDSAIIHTKLLDQIRQDLLHVKYQDISPYIDIINNKKDSADEFNIMMNPVLFDRCFATDDNIQSITGKAFYYHHRLIFNVVIHYHDVVKMRFRHVRMTLLKLLQDVTHYSVLQINQAIQTAPKMFGKLQNDPTTVPLFQDIVSNLDAIRIKTFYQYCVVFQKKAKRFLKESHQIQTFNIPTLQPKFLPFSRKSLVRISIPNMTAYYTNHLSLEYKTEVINTIYKTCLYAKKIDELAITDAYDSYDYDITKQHLSINEKLIMDMWQYSLDSFGGKRTDQIANKSATLGIIFSILAVFFSIVSLIISIL